MSRRFFILTAILFLSFLAVAAQKQTMEFKALTALNGLPTNEVRRLYQDREGYLWIATTDGLCSFDGYQIKTYKSNMYSPGLISNNNIRCVAEDAYHHIYIGTNSGLNILDKQTGKMRNTGNKEFLNNVITAILVTHSGMVLIGTDTELFRYYPENNTCTVCSWGGRRTRQAQHLYEDSKGQVWIGTFNGLFRFDPQRNLFYAYPQLINQSSAHIILEDSYHRLWVGSFRAGLSVIENPYDIDHLKVHSFVAGNGGGNGLPDNVVYSLAEDKTNHTLWVGTRSGVSLQPLFKDRITGTFTNYLPGKEPNIPFDEVDALIQDRQGTIWLGTLGGGVYSINTRQPMFGLNSLPEVRKELTSNSVRSMMINTDGKIWLGIGSYGLVIQDRKAGTYTHFSKMPAFSKFGSMPTLNTIVRLRDGRILMGSFTTGYYEYDERKPMGERAQNYNQNNTPWLMNARVFSIIEDRYGNCWFGTRGLRRCDSKRRGFAFSKFIVEGTDVTNNAFQCLKEQDGRYIWAGTSDAGLVRIANYGGTRERMQFRLYSRGNGKLNSNDVQCIFVDSKDRLWVGTAGGGLNLYDKEKDCFVSMNKLLDLPCDGVFSILEDEEGHLWMGTNAGLLFLRVQPRLEDSSFRMYTISSGLQDNIFMRGCAFKAPDGEMFFGGHRGYNYFYPSKLKRMNQNSKISITDIKIYNESWDAFPMDVRDKISKLAPDFTDKIVLNYKQNNFSIEFSAMNFMNPMQNKYAFRLDGYDHDWQTTDATHRFAYYNNLKSGTYVFHLKVMDENGTWSKNVRTIEVVILPPFWMTWWAYVFYVLIIAGVVYAIWRQGKIRMKQRNKYHLLKVEKAKVEELNHTKLQFFTNITHELLTPLTIISATMDELKKEVPGHQDLYEIMSIHIGRLMRLIQQILEFRKSESGNLRLRVSPGNIATFVKNEAESFAPLIRKRKLHFSVLCNPEDITGYYDSDKLDKIIYNLLSNAAKYNKEGGFVQLNLSYGKDRDLIELSVKDNGEGISEEGRKNLFKRFYEGDYRRFNTIGTGIGLSLTRDLVELHGGTIRVESALGEGTTFFVTLPVGRDYFKSEEIDEQTVPVQKTITDIIEADAADMPRQPENEHTVLLVEDNEDLLQVMLKLLGRDYKVLRATNGKEGIDVIENEDVDIIVSDVMMPEMDGIEFTRYVKNNIDYSHIPIILLTAKNKEEDRAEAYESGADAFITKPFNLTVLHARIRNLLKKKERTARDFKNQLVFEMKELDYTSMDEQFMQKAVDCVNKHLDDSEFDVPQFIDEMGTSKTTLYKKLKSLTGLSTSSFIRNIRLKAACRVMEENPAIRISDLAYEVGFNDPKYFSLCFKKEFGMLPTDYCERFSKEE